MRQMCSMVLAAAVLGVATFASATVVTTNMWKFGENDGRTGGQILVDHTTAATGSWSLYTQPWPTPAPTATYSSDVPAASKLPPGAASTLSVQLTTSNYWQYWANDWKPTDNFGMEVWVKPAALTGTQTIIYAGSPSASGGIGLRLDNALVSLHFGGVGSVSWAAPGLAVNTWTHLAMVRDSGITKLYVNGVDVSPATPRTATPIAPTSAFGVGSYSYGPGTFTGNIDNLRLFTFTGGQFSAANDLMVVVPEPASMGLMALGALGLLHRCRK
jgi:hypothetical protein